MCDSEVFDSIFCCPSFLIGFYLEIYGLFSPLFELKIMKLSAGCAALRSKTFLFERSCSHFSLLSCRIFRCVCVVMVLVSNQSNGSLWIRRSSRRVKSDFYPRIDGFVLLYLTCRLTPLSVMNGLNDFSVWVMDYQLGLLQVWNICVECLFESVCHMTALKRSITN